MKRWLMSEDFSVRTEQSPAQVRTALKSCSWLREERKKTRLRSNREDVDSDHILVFRVMAGIAWRNSFRPQGRCTVQETGNGSRLEVRSRCAWSVRIFMWYWFGMLTLITLGGLASVMISKKWRLLPEVVLSGELVLLWAFGLGLSGLCFWLPERKAKELLCQMVSGELE